MPSNQSEDESRERAAAEFATTHWSTVLAAGDSASPHSKEALEKLCRTYWFPLYAFVRRKGYSPEDAKDLTQAFFERFLEKHYLRDVFADFVSRLPEEGEYTAVGERLGLSSHAVAVAVGRLRERYGVLIRAEIANTVGRPADVEVEMRYLMELVMG